MLPTLAALLVAGLASSEQVDRHRLAKRFIYPNNAIIQFALGLALPADVRGRNIATNSGIMININLPTNLSQLRPPQRSIRESPAHRLVVQQLRHMLHIEDSNKESCLARSMCLLNNQEQPQHLLYDVLAAVFESIFEDNFRKIFLKRRKRNAQLTEDECYQYKQKCSSLFLDHLDEMFL